MDRYLDRELTARATQRVDYWRRDMTSPSAYAESVAQNRERLRKIIGAVEHRVAQPEPHFVHTPTKPAKLAETPLFTAYAIRWPVYEGVEAEGVLLEPKGAVRARVVALPDADQTPEQLAGLIAAPSPTMPIARRLAENGCQVIVPTLVDRSNTFSASDVAKRSTNQTHREWIYRQAYTFGRHVIGYEVDQILAAVDWFVRAPAATAAPAARIGVMGWGEGGLLALYAAAVDPRIDVTLVSGYFGPREQLWAEPMYRNCFGLLREFGDAEVASLIAPRVLIVEPAAAPNVPGPPKATPGQREVAGLGQISTPPLASVRGEVERAQKLSGPYGSGIRLLPEPVAGGLPLGEPTLSAFIQALTRGVQALTPLSNFTPIVDSKESRNDRQRRLVRQLERYTQRLIDLSRGFRDEAVWKQTKLSTPGAWDEAMQPHRDRLWNDVIGRLPLGDTPLNPRSRLLYDRDDSVGYEVMLDVVPGVTVWGYLLVPKNLAPGERRPLVVAQHGRAGLPDDVINEDPAARANQVYRAFASQLVRRGYIVFAPHFPWRGQEDYHRVQRKANPLGLSVFSFILADHVRLLDWLITLPVVDPQRVGLYGLSWGGKVAMRVPALEKRYALSICSGDFNEWIWKNATTDWPNSYMFAPEPDMFDFNLGMTYGYAEMAAMIAPRPFMVERGHDDGVGTDEMVSFEFARVRRLYSKLKILDRTEIEYFDGPHRINGVGTYDFIRKHFNFPPTTVNSSRP